MGHILLHPYTLHTMVACRCTCVIYLYRMIEAYGEDDFWVVDGGIMDVRVCLCIFLISFETRATRGGTVTSQSLSLKVVLLHVSMTASARKTDNVNFSFWTPQN